MPNRRLDTQARQDLLAILTELDALLTQRNALGPGAPLRVRVAQLRRRAESDDARVLASLRDLFLPTAELQEVALDGGWDEEYLVLAARCDAAVRSHPVATRWPLLLALFAAALLAALLLWRWA